LNGPSRYALKIDKQTDTHGTTYICVVFAAIKEVLVCSQAEDAGEVPEM
jgi:hypothetical protein